MAFRRTVKFGDFNIFIQGNFCWNTIENLKLDQESIYYAAVMAVNKYGTSEPSVFKNFTIPTFPTPTP